MAKFLNYFYKYSIILDLLVCIIIVGTMRIIEANYSIDYDTYDRSLSSDLGAIGLTISGFLLTISTILISFKITALNDQQELKNNSNAFKIFISSPLYFKTIGFLNKSVILLIILSLTNYLFKIIFPVGFNCPLFYLNICTMFIILTTFSRCIYLLNLVIKMQH